MVSADSQQIYRGLDVGTAKPTAEERAAVPHHLLDVADPGEGVGRRPLRPARRRGHLGDRRDAGRSRSWSAGPGSTSGRCCTGWSTRPAATPGCARSWRRRRPARAGRRSTRGSPAVDPEAAARIRPNDLVRIVRALEIAASGTTQSELFRAHAFAPERYRATHPRAGPPRGELHERIDARVEAMFREGSWRRRGASSSASGSAPRRSSPSATPRRSRSCVGACTVEDGGQAGPGRDPPVRAEAGDLAAAASAGVEWVTPPWDIESLAQRVIRPERDRVRRRRPCYKAHVSKTKYALDFEKPILALEDKIAELKELSGGARIDFSEEIQKLEKKARRLQTEIFSDLGRWQVVQLARHPAAPLHARLPRRALHRLLRGRGGSAVRRRPRDRLRLRPVRRPAGGRARPPEGADDQGEHAPQLRHAPSRGVPQGAPDVRPRQPLPAADHHASSTPPAPTPASAPRSAARPRRLR